MISVVNGILLARRLKQVHGTVGMASIGDGGTSTGAFHEALNQAAVEKLPLVLVVANNQYAYSTPNDRQFACESLVDKASGYGVNGQVIDGTNLTSCLAVVGDAVQRARAGAGPQMLVANLLRLCGHGEHDDGSYVCSDLKASPVGRDCLKVAEAEILERGWAAASELDALRTEVMSEVESAIARVQREPGPDPFSEDWSALSCKWLSEGQAAAT
jgi:pyruvate dehydrogenase E1 component alpha subunit/2-oxoisovalerate dehydrogenase E1 component alpha subunit